MTPHSEPKTEVTENKVITLSVKTFVLMMLSIFSFFGAILGGVVKIYTKLSDIDTAAQVYREKLDGKLEKQELMNTTFSAGISTLDTKLENHLTAKK